MPSGAATISASTLNSTHPFPGLRPFEETDSDWFFGRSSEINELLKRLRRVRFVAIVGPSGCGKSSLIKAGVLPSVRDGYLDSSWLIAAFRPGEQPLDNLAHAVSTASSADVDSFRKLLDTGSMGLIKAIQARQLATGSKLLILVDQFEELFQFAQRHGDQSQEEVKAFLKLLLSAASSDDVPVYLVLTMRMEWLSECATYVGLAEAINEGIYLVPQMSRRQFQQVILNPIDKANGAITTTLLDRMLNDIGGRTDQLPVLQHALMRLWECRRPGEPMDIPDYEAVGTFSHCLSNHAEEVFNELNGKRQKVAELLFRSITQVYKNRKIRRPRPLSELASVPGMDAAELNSVIEEYGRQGRSFLFVSEGALQSSSVIDISHEALMRQWGRLAGWVEDEAEQESRLGRLQEDAAEWDRTGRKDRSLLYSGYKLQKAEEVGPRLGDSKIESDFLVASRKAERSARLLRNGALFLPLLLLVVLAQAFAYMKARQAQKDATNAEHRAELETQKATDALQQVQRNTLRAQAEQANITSITKEISIPGGSAKALAAIQQTLNAKRIYLQYVGDALPLAQLCGANLKKSGYLVPGYEKVDANKSPSKNQVRYFYPDEKPEADDIAGKMNQWVTGGVESKLLGNPNNIVPQGQFEVWIAAGATATTSSVAPSVSTTSARSPASKEPAVSNTTTATASVNPPSPPISPPIKETPPSAPAGMSAKVAEFYRKAQAGDVSAMADLGGAYLDGDGVSRDYQQALTWCRKAAEAGNARGMTELGYMYQDGSGVGKDYAQAVYWFRKGAEAGDVHGMRSLGFIYAFGRGVVGKDYAQAVYWYRKAAEAGDATDMTELGSIYYYVGKDYAQAVYWYRKAAEAGDARGMTELGSMYFEGLGVGKDYAQAVYWYRKAADAGNPRAMSNLGIAYAEGQGVTKDYLQAASWCRKSADARNPGGMACLGFLYEKGLGVPKDKQKAINWYREAALYGDQTAEKKLKKLGGTILEKPHY